MQEETDHLERHFERSRARIDDLRPQRVRTPHQPEVVRREKLMDIPASVWGNEQYGNVDELLEYFRTVNAIPDEAYFEASMDESQNLKVRFSWWEVTIVTDSRIRLTY
jgi:hypothetical protein